MNSKKSRSVVSNLTKMKNADSLKVIQNEDGSYSLEWDKNDPKWKFLNKLNNNDIQEFVQDALRNDRRLLG